MCFIESEDNVNGKLSVTNKSKMHNEPKTIPPQQKAIFLYFGLNFTIELMIFSMVYIKRVLLYNITLKYSKSYSFNIKLTYIKT